MKVAILGSGMPALVAAHAVTEWCVQNFLPDPEIAMYGPPERQKSHGARFYEREIPNLSVPQAMCITESHGDPDAYLKKLCSPLTRYTRPRPDFLVFDYHQAYATLWDTYHHTIRPMTMENGDFRRFVNDSEWSDFDYVISTVGRYGWYDPTDIGYFAATRHWRLDETPDEFKSPYVLPGNNVDKNRMIFDGTEDTSWFRITQTFGLMTVEWPFPKRPPIQGVHLEILPLGVPETFGLRNTIPAWRGTEALAHVGALARWAPSTDVAEVFSQVQTVLSGEQGEVKNDRSNTDGPTDNSGLHDGGGFNR